MNKNYMFVGIGIILVIIIIIIIFSGSAAQMNLDQILENEDCVALEKLELEHIYDENLNLTSEQKNKIMSVGFGCVGKAMNNMFGGGDSSSTLLEEQKEILRVFDKIIETRDCDEMREWTSTYGKLPAILTHEQKITKIRFDSSCNPKY